MNKLLKESWFVFCDGLFLICFWDLINLNLNKYVLMGKIKKEFWKWKENKFVNWVR